MEKEYNSNFMEKLNQWIPQNCNSVIDAKNNIAAEKLRRIDWLGLLMKGLQVVEAVVTICFPEIAPFIAIANLVLSGGVRIYKKLKKHEKINWFEELLDIGIDTVLSLSKIKGFKKGVGKIGKYIGGKINQGGKLAKMAGKIGVMGKNLKKFGDNINKVLDKNKVGRLAKNVGKRVGKGIQKDIRDRKDEYKSTLIEIGEDICVGKDPSEKITKLVLDGVYNGCCKASIDYINEKMAEKKYLDKKFVRGALNTLGNF